MQRKNQPVVQKRFLPAPIHHFNIEVGLSTLQNEKSPLLPAWARSPQIPPNPIEGRYKQENKSIYTSSYFNSLPPKTVIHQKARSTRKKRISKDAFSVAHI